MNDILEIKEIFPLASEGAGVMISRGTGRHVERTAAHFTLIFVLQGQLYIEENGREFVVEPGHTLLLWPGRLHRGTREYTPDLQFFWLHFTLKSLQQGYCAHPIPQFKEVARPEVITELFHRLLDDQSNGLIHSVEIALHAWLILLEVARELPHQGDSRAALAHRVYTYMSIHHHEGIFVSDIAKAIGYSSQYLSRVYRKTYNHSPVEALRRMRIEHAKFLLMQTDHNLKHIAEQVGFEDASYFQSLFKKLEGITPGQFRHLHTHTDVLY